MTPRLSMPMRAIALSVSLSSMVTMSQVAHAQAADSLYYQIGGASPFSISAGRGHDPLATGIGVRWNVDASCGNFDIGATVSNQLNGITDGFQNMMGNVVQNAQGAVASLPAMIIQRSNPGLYDLLSNGVLQGRVDFDRSKLSCQNMADGMADMVMGQGLQQMAIAENWQATAQTNSDAVSAQEAVEETGGDNGVTWVGGQKRGGRNQDPMNVVKDTAKAGYNLLHGRTNPTADAPVSGAGGGWGSIPTNTGTWIGGGASGGTGGSAPGGTSGSACRGGMCSVWQTPEEASSWVRKIVGDDDLQTCNDCEQRQSQAGTGLIRELEQEQEDIAERLASLVSGATQANPENLREVSAGDGFMVSRGAIEALRNDPHGNLLTHRLAVEMATARTLTKAMWARRMLLAGASDPGIANNETGMQALDRRLAALDRDIDTLKSEMEIRQSLASNAASVALDRATRRAAVSSDSESLIPDSVLDSRGQPKAEGGE